ncbi:diacylglycerol O-acyltransferase 1 [Planoprotostelium fungivorum]|uniref:O-acyltransferase n=1 Tax=Planoprotostelium fungivorum TaxID=1890364 RepID=A0A2P6N9G6_9EUKA|nr:diacylglycerol O-acyltransferase 1 [Planoprotostelium fungivorum]
MGSSVAESNVVENHPEIDLDDAPSQSKETNPTENMTDESHKRSGLTQRVKNTAEAAFGSAQPTNHLKKSAIPNVYQTRASLLSSESPSTQSYRGFINLGIILLVLSNLRLVIINILKYGILLDIEKIKIKEWYRWPGVIIFLMLNIFILVGFVLEKLAKGNRIADKQVILLQSINIGALVLIPSVLVWQVQPNPDGRILVMMFMTVYMMKLSSYAHVNYHLRQEYRAGRRNNYPSNITLKDIYYFMVVPATVYQQDYPRTQRIRKGWLARRIAEMVRKIFFLFLIVVIVEQYITPLVRNSLAPLNNANLLQISERLLKLSIPNLFVWLLGFYVFFHLGLNILAEFCTFADREFYKDWWNSTTIGYFWRNWNMPVHNWMMTHVYIPCIKRGYSKIQSGFICFLLSAIFHELIIGVPFQMLKGWAFAGMMVQIPGGLLSERLRGKQWGNVAFWFSIVLGQPFCVLMMYRDWYHRNYEQ